jgi:hypothetical protein
MPSNNSKTKEKERQIELQIQKEAEFLVAKAIVRQPLYLGVGRLGLLGNTTSI